MREPVAPVAPGTTCIHNIKSKPWPVVICSDEVAPPQFVAVRKDPKHQPAILLGRHKYIFIRPDAVEPINPLTDYLANLKPFAEKEIQPDDPEEVVEEKQRRRAFREEAHWFKDHHFWANYIQQTSEIRKMRIEQRGTNIAAHQTHRASGNRSDDQTLGRRKGYFQESSATPKRQKVDTMGQLYRLASTTQTPRMSGSRARKDSVLSELIEIDDDDYEKQSFASGVPLPTVPIPRSTRGSIRDHEKVYQSIKDPDENIGSSPPSNSPGPLECRIFFPHGQPSSLSIKRELISRCPYLAARACDDEGTSQLDLRNDKRAMETNLAASDLAVVLEFYATGEIGPRLVNQRGNDPEISVLDQQNRKKDKHAETLGKAFVAAVKIEDELLQDLIHKKLSALYPLTPLGILIVAKCISKLPKSTWSIQHEIRTWITAHILEYYWVLANNHVDMLQKLLEDDDEMRTTIYDGLKIDPQAGKGGFDVLQSG